MSPFIFRYLSEQETLYMEINYLNSFINFVVPKDKSVFILTNNKQELLQQKKYYDYIVLIYVLEKEEDILALLTSIRSYLNPNGRLVVIYHNYLYSFLKGLFKSVLDRKNISDSWLSTRDIATFLNLSHFDLLLFQPLCLLPVSIPLISGIFNRLLLYIFPLNHLAVTHYVIASKKNTTHQDHTTSIIIPARNEQGNIKHIFQSIQVLGIKTEVIFVEGHSQDKTREEIQKYMKKYENRPDVSYKLFKQSEFSGKFGAVRIGFAHATGDILIIYDCDMTIQPADLQKFYDALISHEGDFINGSRLVYPIEEGSMQFLNILGNKFFSLLYSWLFGQPIKDTLCGTKALWRQDYLSFTKNKRYDTRSVDPFGDFYLLYAAARLNLKIVDLPVRYFSRTYGSTNISRFKNAWQLCKFSFFVFKSYKMKL